jgi:hypothetical protein
VSSSTHEGLTRPIPGTTDPFQLDETIPKWKGWHCYALGVKPKVIQAILRHSDIVTTLGFYVETSESESREALDKLTGLMG